MAHIFIFLFAIFLFFILDGGNGIDENEMGTVLLFYKIGGGITVLLSLWVLFRNTPISNSSESKEKILDDFLLSSNQKEIEDTLSLRKELLAAKILNGIILILLILMFLLGHNYNISSQTNRHASQNASRQYRAKPSRLEH
jgi:hypothetical protein